MYVIFRSYHSSQSNTFTFYVLDNYAPVNAQAYITAITNADVLFLIFSLLYFFCHHYRIIISFQVAVRFYL